MDRSQFGNNDINIVEDKKLREVINRREKIKNRIKNKEYSKIYKTILSDKISRGDYSEMKEYFIGDEYMLQQYSNIINK
jgi:hypothetical protein